MNDWLSLKGVTRYYAERWSSTWKTTLRQGPELRP